MTRLQMNMKSQESGDIWSADTTQWIVQSQSWMSISYKEFLPFGCNNGDWEAEA